MKIKILSDGGYTIKKWVSFPFVIEDPDAEVIGDLVEISGPLLSKAGFTHCGNARVRAFCLKTHEFGEEAVILEQ